MPPKLYEPTKEERQSHEATHCPFRAWCEVCVKAKSPDGKHTKQLGIAEDFLLIEFDYSFATDTPGDPIRKISMMVATDSIHGSIFAVVARRKGGQDDYVMQSFLNYIVRLGFTGWSQIEHEVDARSFVGRLDRTGEYLLLSPTGAMKTRCVRRLEGDSAWNLQFLNLCVGSPWNATARSTQQTPTIQQKDELDSGRRAKRVYLRQNIWTSTDALQGAQVVLELGSTQRNAEQELNKKWWTRVMQFKLRLVEKLWKSQMQI